MADINTNLIDISKYKCVPLDLLKNVSSTNQVKFNATTEGTPLTNFTNEQKLTLAQVAPLKASLSGAMIETIIASVAGIMGFLIIVVFLINGGLNVRKNGWGAFITLPTVLQTAPVIIVSSGIFGLLGFLLGYFIR